MFMFQPNLINISRLLQMACGIKWKEKPHTIKTQAKAISVIFIISNIN